MSQFDDQNIQKDMIDCDLIDVESLDLSDDQTWLYTLPDDTGEKVDILEWNLSCDWPQSEDEEFIKLENDLYAVLDNILKNDALSLSDKHKFDSRTYVKPKRRPQRPSIQSIVENSPPSLSHALTPGNKYQTYNKYSSPLGQMLRLKTFNVDANTDNSDSIKEYATKRRSVLQDDDPQLDEDIQSSLNAERLAEGDTRPTKPINIDLSQPVHNIHNTFNRCLPNMLNERGSLNMFQSGESLMRMSPPSLVSSLMMESSGNFNQESLEGRKSMASHRDSGLPTSARESIDPMVTSMTLSILDEKDMSTSFLSQTTYQDNDSLMDSLPPSLVSSVNSSFVVSNTSKPRQDSIEANVFSSATFTHLEQSDRLLSSRPRHQMFNSFTKKDTPIRNSESYVKSRDETADQVKVLNENTDKKEASKPVNKLSPEMTETVTLHYSNNKFKHKDAEKENLNSTFQKDDAFYRDMGLEHAMETGKHSLNITHDKQELNEIKQARQKLSLARKGLPNDIKVNQDVSPSRNVERIQLPNQTIIVPKQSMENASELLSRRRAVNTNGYNRDENEKRETPKRNSTFKKASPKSNLMDATIVFVKDDNEMIDINSATLNLIDSGEKTLRSEGWGSQERAMVGSSESTDTGTFSSSSPPESVPDATASQRPQIASTPLMSLRKGKSELLNIQNTISPIYDILDDKSYTVNKSMQMERTYNAHTTVVNTDTIVKKSSVKRDILSNRLSPEKPAVVNVQRKPIEKVSPTRGVTYGVMPPPTTVPRKTNLPTSKLRQYSSHKELNRIPGNNTVTVPRILTGNRTMVRRGVYASNPALSPTASGPPDSNKDESKAPQRPVHNEAAAVAPPPLVRQGTETLRRERPQSQLIAPKDPPSTRPYSIASASQLRVTRPSSGPSQKTTVPVSNHIESTRPASSDARVSALPRPSRLPAPRRGLRPPSVYSVAPTTDGDHY